MKSGLYEVRPGPFATAVAAACAKELEGPLHEVLERVMLVQGERRGNALGNVLDNGSGSGKMLLIGWMRKRCWAGGLLLGDDEAHGNVQVSVKLEGLFDQFPVRFGKHFDLDLLRNADDVFTADLLMCKHQREIAFHAMTFDFRWEGSPDARDNRTPLFVRNLVVLIHKSTFSAFNDAGSIQA